MLCPKSFSPGDVYSYLIDSWQLVEKYDDIELTVYTDSHLKSLEAEHGEYREPCVDGCHEVGQAHEDRVKLTVVRELVIGSQGYQRPAGDAEGIEDLLKKVLYY